MAITYPVDVPISDLARITVRENTANVAQFSGFTSQGVVQEYEGDHWGASIGYSRLPRSLAQDVSAFVSKLRGAKGTLVLSFPGYDEPLGAAKDNPSSPAVNGSGQAGNEELLVKSGPASITDWLLPGDIIQVGPANRPHWHKVLQAVDTDGSGNATIDVWPRVREGTVDSDLVAYTFPLCLFRMIDQVSFEIERPVLHTFDFTFREAI